MVLYIVQMLMFRIMQPPSSQSCAVKHSSACLLAKQKLKKCSQSPTSKELNYITELKEDLWCFRGAGASFMRTKTEQLQ